MKRSFFLLYCVVAPVLAIKAASSSSESKFAGTIAILNCLSHEVMLEGGSVFGASLYCLQPHTKRSDVPIKNMDSQKGFFVGIVTDKRSTGKTVVNYPAKQLLEPGKTYNILKNLSRDPKEPAYILSPSPIFIRDSGPIPFAKCLTRKELAAMREKRKEEAK